MESAVWSSYNSFMLSHDVERLRKVFGREELFKKTITVPGDIVECGVFKGVSLMQFAKMREIFCPAAAKKIIGFDTFKLPELVDVDDQKRMENFFSGCGIANGDTINKNELLDLANEISRVNSVELIEGDICVEAEKYCKSNPGFRISLLHLDLDVYQPTLAALKAFWPRISRGGIVIFDEYALSSWTESGAVDEYFKNEEVVLETIPWVRTPTAYLIKK